MAIEVVFFDIGDTLISKKRWLPGALDCVRAIKEKKIRVGLISNTGNLTRDDLQRLLPEDFDFAIFEEGLTLLSSEVGIEKPNLGIFSLAVQHAGVSPWQTMFVGESLTESLAAQQAGMQAARITDPEADFKALRKSL
ncbi:HAD family hydrolase [Mariniblastus fucicola]|uniref:D-glucose-1-phosphatase n=1 Tax=Mariniblastus fucicola TaxID=980251 RepID=A0A5B9PQ78_9BACT|nr:HAD family hydrolase [Mariniblastus fucicola]QEG24621.1 D-glucose-1-phosphatase [Mariniblastus fucicola]